MKSIDCFSNSLPTLFLVSSIHNKIVTTKWDSAMKIRTASGVLAIVIFTVVGCGPQAFLKKVRAREPSIASYNADTAEIANCLARQLSDVGAQINATMFGGIATVTGMSGPYALWELQMEDGTIEIRANEGSTSNIMEYLEHCEELLMTG